MIRVLNGRIWYCYGRKMKFVSKIEKSMSKEQIIEKVIDWLYN